MKQHFFTYIIIVSLFITLIAKCKLALPIDIVYFVTYFIILLMLILFLASLQCSYRINKHSL